MILTLLLNLERQRLLLDRLYKNQVIHTFNVNKDEDYYFNGSYGKMKLEVKDGKWRITEEECPNHICSSIGWVSVKDYFPIVCIPNEVIVTLKDN